MSTAMVPSGPSLHQDLLDQMSADISGTRPPVIDLELYHLLSELKAFRHLVRHRYGFDLEPRKVAENVESVRLALPLFVAAVAALERVLASDDRNESNLQVPDDCK